jgi:hypothetical protein
VWGGDSVVQEIGSTPEQKDARRRLLGRIMIEEISMKIPASTAFLTAAFLANPGFAQTPNDPAIEACRVTGLIALRERSPSVKDLAFDMESLAVSKANTKVEDIPVRMVIMGEAYLERKETGKAQRFVCLIGEKGKVLLTFFIAQ